MSQESIDSRMQGGFEPAAAIAPVRISLPHLNAWSRWRRFVGGPTGAVLGGILFALWAALVNRDGGIYVSLRSSCGQFFASSVLTMVDARMMERLFHACRGRIVGASVAAIGSLLVTYALVLGVHTALHTPHIFLTILPGLLPTLGFTAMYTLLLLREQAHFNAH